MDDKCVFVPANEPWSCSVHPAGYRTALDQTECSIVLGEGTLKQLGRDIRAYGDYRAKQARAQSADALRAAEELLREAETFIALRPSGHTGSLDDRIPWFQHGGIAHGEDRPHCMACQHLARVARALATSDSTGARE
jgi:hypothetical protein